jgi:SAM-dependent methyltransferase
MVVGALYRNEFLASVFHTTIHCVRRELAGCKSVLDLGCGPASPLMHVAGIERSVGVDAFAPYIEAARAKGTHTEYRCCPLDEVEFPDKAFDAVLLVEVIEHLPEAEALQVLARAERWGRKVVITSPNGFIAQQEIDGNPYQKHLSGWSLARMRELGYTCRGLAGLKVLRQEAYASPNTEDFLASVRWRPRFFWFVVATLSQLITYYWPRHSFGLLSVKRPS